MQQLDAPATVSNCWAGTPGGDVQAVRVGDSAWGILDHPEELRAETARRQAASAAFGEHLAHRFADQVLLRGR